MKLATELFIRINSGVTPLSKGELLQAQFGDTEIGKAIKQLIEEDKKLPDKNRTFVEFTKIKDRYAYFTNVLYIVALINLLEDFNKDTENAKTKDFNYEHLSKYFSDTYRNLSFSNKTTAITYFMEHNGDSLNSDQCQKVVENIKKCVHELRSYSKGWKDELNQDSRFEGTSFDGDDAKLCFANLEYKSKTFNEAILTSTIAAYYNLCFSNGGKKGDTIYSKPVNVKIANMRDSLYKLRTDTTEYTPLTHNSTANKNTVLKRISLTMEAMFPCLTKRDPQRSCDVKDNDRLYIEKKHIAVFNKLCCPYCAGTVDPNDSTTHKAHIRAYSSEGKTVKENTLYAHDECNKENGNSPLYPIIIELLQTLKTNGKLIGSLGEDILLGKISEEDFINLSSRDLNKYIDSNPNTTA